jgi:hypothetical protein
MTWDGRGDMEEGTGKGMKGIEWEMREKGVRIRGTQPSTRILAVITDRAD